MATRGAELLEHLLGAAEFDATAGLAALAAREKAEAALEKGNAAEAEALLNEAIGLNARGGRHLVYRSRSKARLALGDISGVLEDADEAIRIAPRFPQILRVSFFKIESVYGDKGKAKRPFFFVKMG